MGNSLRYSPKVRDRAVGETLSKWVRQADRDLGKREGMNGSERQRLKELERENRELQRADRQAACARGH